MYYYKIILIDVTLKLLCKEFGKKTNFLEEKIVVFNFNEFDFFYKNKIKLYQLSSKSQLMEQHPVTRLSIL